MIRLDSHVIAQTHTERQEVARLEQELAALVQRWAETVVHTRDAALRASHFQKSEISVTEVNSDKYISSLL
jgi:hypothetical protein